MRPIQVSSFSSISVFFITFHLESHIAFSVHVSIFRQLEIISQSFLDILKDFQASYFAMAFIFGMSDVSS